VLEAVAADLFQSAPRVRTRGDCGSGLA
jgi:hypothetical protein